jgi:hypothetical protein
MLGPNEIHTDHARDRTNGPEKEKTNGVRRNRRHTDMTADQHQVGWIKYREEQAFRQNGR